MTAVHPLELIATANVRNGWKADARGSSNLLMSRREFLVVYDYGMGGVWGFVRAQSEREIHKAFPELKVVAETPPWMTSEHEKNVRSVSSFTIGETTTYPRWLQVLLASRRSA